MSTEPDGPDDEITILPAPFGWLRLTARGDMLTGIDVLVNELEVKPPNTAFLAAAAEQFSRYFENPSYPLSLPLQAVGTIYQTRIWTELRRIPLGKTDTYTGLANKTGSGPRAIAGACKANPYPIIVPCHRVLALHGLGGYCGAQEGAFMAVKRWLLQHEGVRLD